MCSKPQPQTTQSLTLWGKNEGTQQHQESKARKALGSGTDSASVSASLCNLSTVPILWALVSLTGKWGRCLS